jgi:hypothetical protein
MAIADDRAKAVELALAQIEKQFGKGSIVRLGSKEALLPIAVISTGSISFDAALGVGGIPRGRVTRSSALSPPARPPSPSRSSPKPSARRPGRLCRCRARPRPRLRQETRRRRR